MTICSSCAATEIDGAAFPPKVRRSLRLCTSCTEEMGRMVARAASANEVRAFVTRASYRARARNRRASAQSDMVDQIVRCP